MHDNPRMIVAMIRNSKKGLLIAMMLVLPAAAALAGPGGTDRPLVGACDAVVTPLTPTQLEIDLACQFRHLGRTTGTIVQEVIPTGEPVNNVLPVAISSVITYTAANGDLLRSTYGATGTINLGTGAVTFQGLETFDGGTGRFESASGTGFLAGHASIFTNLGFYVTSGTLSY